ncbi:RecQ-mediated genome instability protein 1 [Geosmithia morbida]|uniref:RecQ-mediated genome instability protein 1 n=1 Tax=Geosmithia morbida TaxID=1094350 RepID=A0A9P4Z3N2_9HYPO|nr:RecQ-mediated genome instability protein 1 [Geosmithia morbida]KAF4126029.1 RecQ-mediated genome instability protein 1 [Geosmithia morbida]
MDLTDQLRSFILSQSLPPPSSSLLTSLTTARNPPPPLPSLVATARARLLACDLSSSSLVDSLSMTALPSSACDPSTREMCLATSVHVQVVDVENLSLSRWDQAEELESIERGERTQGRQVIRVEDNDDGEPAGGGDQTQQRAAGGGGGAGKNAMHRLTLQDCSGTRIYALEVWRLPVGLNTTVIGEKILLKAGTLIARGTVLLTPDCCVFLGGKIDAWNRSWAEGRLARLKDSVGANI